MKNMMKILKNNLDNTKKVVNLNWGFDIDGCVADIMQPMLHNINKTYGYKLTTADITTFSIEECTNLSRAKVYEVVNRTLADVDNIHPYLGAIEFLKYYHSITGTTIEFITARWDREATNRQISKWLIDIPFNITYSKGEHKSKSANKRDIKVFVDDRLEVATILANQGIKVLLLNREWNQGSNSSNIIRVKDWDEIKDYFDRS